MSDRGASTPPKIKNNFPNKMRKFLMEWNRICRQVNRNEYMESKTVIRGRKRIKLSAACHDNSKFSVNMGTMSTYNNK
jgi:hypothetical protein